MPVHYDPYGFDSFDTMFGIVFVIIAVGFVIVFGSIIVKMCIRDRVRGVVGEGGDQLPCVGVQPDSQGGAAMLLSLIHISMQFGRPVYEEKQYLKKRGKDGILITSISFPIKNGDRIVGAIDLSMQESEEEEDELPEGRIELSRDSFHRDRTQKLSASASAAFPSRIR